MRLIRAQGEQELFLVETMEDAQKTEKDEKEGTACPTPTS